MVSFINKRAIQDIFIDVYLKCQPFSHGLTVWAVMPIKELIQDFAPINLYSKFHLKSVKIGKFFDHTHAQIDIFFIPK